MKGWLLLLLLITVVSCQSERSSGRDSEDKIIDSVIDTVFTTGLISEGLVFLFQKEGTAHLGDNTLSIKDLSLLHRLPPGLYPIKKDTIRYGIPVHTWTSTGRLQWPENGKVALMDILKMDTSINIDQVAIFPNRPEGERKLEPCFACPPWMAEQYGKLGIIWEAEKKSFVPLPEK